MAENYIFGKRAVVTVSELTNSIRDVLTATFSETLYIRGEISNFKRHSSGHWYFTLKDMGAQISCSMWKSYNGSVKFLPAEGTRVVISGVLDVYPPHGTYKFDVRSMTADGEGELYKSYIALKNKLEEAGYFEANRKKTIPSFPRKIGIVTSPTGAAIQDMISCATRRYPLVELVLFPAKVEGDGSSESIVAGIKALQRVEGIDVIIIGRGGGSIENLWAFNEERTAEAIFKSTIPIISGVGHETDTTISDFVADLRAATPTAAMELATPNLGGMDEILKNYNFKLVQLVTNKVNSYKEVLNKFSKGYGFKLPARIIFEKMQTVDFLSMRIKQATENILEKNRNKLELFHTKIAFNNIDEILKKGFSLVEQNGKVIKRMEELADGKFSIRFYDGSKVIQ